MRRAGTCFPRHTGMFDMESQGFGSYWSGPWEGCIWWQKGYLLTLLLLFSLHGHLLQGVCMHIKWQAFEFLCQDKGLVPFQCSVRDIVMFPTGAFWVLASILHFKSAHGRYFSMSCGNWWRHSRGLSLGGAVHKSVCAGKDWSLNLLCPLGI